MVIKAILGAGAIFGMFAYNAALSRAETAETVAQQWRPPVPANLQVLPKDTTGPQVVQMMRGFALGLGVRCEHCHAGEGNDLSTFDFASDAKPQKEIARRMMRMTREINAAHLANFPADRQPNVPAVTCYTCHRGQTKPLTAAPAAPR